MSINFEAANMAGYNNPKIEVFEATIDLSTNTFSDAPSKTEIIRCLSRGSIPAMLMTTPDGSASLLWITVRRASAEGDTIQFINAAATITYSPESDTPSFGLHGQ